jgi:hypothetical protein
MEPLIWLYASRTGSSRNLTLLRAYKWRLLVSATGVWRHEGFPYACDNGAWTYFAKGIPFDHGRYAEFLSVMGANALWVVLPDKVEDAAETARLTDYWLGRGSPHPQQRWLACIQDGAQEADLERIVPYVHGFFLGGSTEYKLSTLAYWGSWCSERGLNYHVGRVNSPKRIKLCIAAGAWSCDGTNATKFSVNIPSLSRAGGLTCATTL